MRVGIVGLGYVGATLAQTAQQAGHDVVGIEINPSRVKELGETRYRIGSHFQVIEDRELIVIAVPTPLNSKRDPDLNYLKSACDLIAKYAKKRNNNTRNSGYAR